MNLATFVEFDADFPDDSEWNAENVPIVAGGRNILCALREQFEKHGFSCSDAKQHSFYGWALDLRKGSRLYTMVIQGAGPWLVICESGQPLIRRLLGSSSEADIDGFLHILHGILTDDSRFSNIYWFTKAEYDSGCQTGRDVPA